MPPERRVALVVAKALTPGQAANVSALLMGQLSAADNDLYADPVAGADGNEHAGIRHSTVVLRAGSGQLSSLARTAREQSVTSCVFSALGQRLNNAFEQYRAELQSSDTIDLVGVGILGEDPVVRGLTRKFSLLQ